MTRVMLTVGILVLLTAASFSNGLNRTRRYYKDLNCTADESGAYDCSLPLNLKIDKCYYKGREYSIGDRLPNFELDASCKTRCRCTEMYIPGEAKWECVQIECPELFSWSRDPKCVYLYDHSSCCSVSSNCEGNKIEKESVPRCEYGGKTYLYGEKFFPEELPCKKCICNEGFNGSLIEPWCQTFSCNVYIHYLDYIRSGCIPLYPSEDSCCPTFAWRCPEEDDQIIPPRVPVDNSTTALKCKFGKLELAVGEKLSPKKLSGSCNDCSCEIPPLLTCVSTDCEN